MILYGGWCCEGYGVDVKERTCYPLKGSILGALKLEVVVRGGVTSWGGNIFHYVRDEADDIQ